MLTVQTDQSEGRVLVLDVRGQVQVCIAVLDDEQGRDLLDDRGVVHRHHPDTDGPLDAPVRVRDMERQLMFRHPGRVEHRDAQTVYPDDGGMGALQGQLADGSVDVVDVAGQVYLEGLLLHHGLVRHPPDGGRGVAGEHLEGEVADILPTVAVGHDDGDPVGTLLLPCRDTLQDPGEAIDGQERGVGLEAPGQNVGCGVDVAGVVVDGIGGTIDTRDHVADADLGRIVRVLHREGHVEVIGNAVVHDGDVDPMGTNMLVEGRA